MSFASDEKASWKKYQLAMPISNFTVVASKYVSVIYTVAISILGSIAFNSLSSIIFQNFDMLILVIFDCSSNYYPIIMDRNLLAINLLVWFSFCANYGIDCGNSNVLLCKNILKMGREWLLW